MGYQHVIITLCWYAQLSYVFGHVGLSVYVAKKLTKNCQKKLFSALPFEKILLCALIVKFKHLQSGFLHPASCTDRAILCMFYLKLTMGYCITVCHTFFLCIMQHVAAQRHVECTVHAVQLSLHALQSSDIALSWQTLSCGLGYRFYWTM